MCCEGVCVVTVCVCAVVEDSSSINNLVCVCVRVCVRVCCEGVCCEGVCVCVSVCV